MLQVNVSATLGTLNVAAEVDGVKIKGDGEMHMTLSSSLLPNLNRQLQFVTYTNTLFHPSTADTGERGSSDLWVFEKKPQRIKLGYARVILSALLFIPLYKIKSCVPLVD